MDGVECGVTVNAVAPFAATRMTAVDDSALEGAKSPDAVPDCGSPAYPANLVAYLVHESCNLTGETYFAGSGRVARIFIGETRGIVDPSVTPETLGVEWDRVNATEDAHVVGDVADWYSFQRSLVEVD
jgi:hypothetical protein